jgi:hypothetical protein
LGAAAIASVSLPTLPLVIEVLASELIRAANECSANTPSHDVKAAEFSGRRDL